MFKGMSSEFFHEMPPKNTLIVFDLDYTLWPFWVDTHVRPPFEKNVNGIVFDSLGQKVQYYPEVLSIFKFLKKEGYPIAIASRTGEIQGAHQLLKLFDWEKYIDFKEIYPGSKTMHFGNFHKFSGRDYKDMIFFDDERRNILDINKLGVTSILVKNGMNFRILRDGLAKHARRN